MSSYIHLSIEIVVKKVVVATSTITVSEESKKHIIKDLEDKVRKELHIPPQFTVIAKITKQRPQEPGDGFYPEFGYTGNRVDFNLDNNWTKQKKLLEKVAQQQKTSLEHRSGKGLHKGMSGGKESHYTNPDKAAKRARKNAQRKGR